jgi:uncharacterized membrane protein
VATLVAVGAVTRFVSGELAMLTPTPVYGVVIKLGLTETLTFIIGFSYGIIAGFIGGALIIAISDLTFLPGPWTPFIAAIIGLTFGVGGGLVRRFEIGTPRITVLGVAAIILTVVSETLQNSWVAVFYSVPLAASLLYGVPSLIAALVNNSVLLAAIGPRVITAIRKQR